MDPKLSDLDEEALIARNQALGVQQDAIKAERQAINAELAARRSQLDAARAEVARLEGVAVAGQTIEATSGVLQ